MPQKKRLWHYINFFKHQGQKEQNICQLNECQACYYAALASTSLHPSDLTLLIKDFQSSQKSTLFYISISLSEIPYSFRPSPFLFIFLFN